MISGHSIDYLATDVGVWMALPAFAPALAVAGVVIYVMRRDRRLGPDTDEADRVIDHDAEGDST